MSAEHHRPDGSLMQGYFCSRCGEGGVNMLASGHGPGKCEPNPTLVARLREINEGPHMNDQTKTKPRDYRDAGDIAEQLDTIRVAPREEAMALYQTCLDVAHAQGRAEVAAEMVGRTATLLRTLAADLVTGLTEVTTTEDRENGKT
ncbi:MAG TPA: hypothetical protein VHT52_23980 [Stellaceae bacterium]|jgi:hypothetical protein|nr:hypothetical protein [Stellaceae bacterium]